MKTIFYAFARRRNPSDGKFLAPGKHDNIEDVMRFIPPKGPPLPLVVACYEDKASDLDVIQDAIDRIGGGDTVQGAEAFVKAMIAEVGHLAIWPNHASFYGLIHSPKVRKFIALHYEEQVVDYLTGTKDYTIYSFPTFIGAFVYVLAGGNGKLNGWKLPQWCAMGRAKRALMSASPPISPNRPSTSKEVMRSPPPTRQAEGSGRSKGRLNTPVNEEKQQDDRVEEIEDEPYIVPNTLVKGKQPLARKSNEARASLKSVAHEPTTSARALKSFSLPQFLVPPAYLSTSSVTSKPLAFVTDRTTKDGRSARFIASDASSVPSINGPIRNDKVLPPLLTHYLLAHGWDTSVVEVMGSIYHGDVSMDGFLNLMGRAFSMPLTEAAYVWYLMEHLRKS